MRKKKFKGAIFDLDGTLLESTHVWHQIDVDFLGSRGFDIPEDYVEAITPMEFKEIADYTIERFGLKETPEAVMQEWNDMAIDAYSHQVELKPGVRQLLEALRDQGISMGVATSNIADLYLPCLRRNGILEFFHSFTECGEVGAGKKDPDIYLKAAEKLGCEPGECLVFEDILMGLETAKKAGFTTVCVKDGAWDYTKEDLEGLADYVLEEIQGG
ncbi:MAG: HAD family phosphatase [Eubacterium sp.]|nr:HAD family phosphatase [Eubacterium sp.]